MGSIGKPERRILIPKPDERPAPEPVVEPAEPVKQPEPVPA
jgi:hypothetical protein